MLGHTAATLNKKIAALAGLPLIAAAVSASNQH